jgi:hypothetical protein
MQDQPTTKPCKKCGKVLPLTAFPTRKSAKDGHRHECFTCNAAYHAAYYSERREEWKTKGAIHYVQNRSRVAANSAAYYRAHREEYIARAREWVRAHPDQAKESFRKSAHRQSKMRPDRVLALTAVHAATKKGTLIRQPCQNCGNPKSEGHHHLGYAPEHYLDVIWLCRRCHEDVHHPKES